MRTLRRLGGLGLCFLPVLAAADEVQLRGGGKVTGVIVDRTKDTVVIETGPGRVTLAMSRVVRILDGTSALAAYRERAAALSAHDVDGWAALARWAADRDLQTQSLEAWQRVLAFDPLHPEANAALGRAEVNGVWMSQDKAYRTRGYVPFEGRWVTPAEYEILARQQYAEEAARQERREGDLRVREAEARAREAEARAREAEAGAQEMAYPDGGMPYGWVFAGGGGILPPGRLRPSEHPAHPRPPVVATPPKTAPRPTTPPPTTTTSPSHPKTPGGLVPPPPLKSPKD